MIRFKIIQNTAKNSTYILFEYADISKNSLYSSLATRTLCLELAKWMFNWISLLAVTSQMSQWKIFPRRSALDLCFLPSRCRWRIFPLVTLILQMSQKSAPSLVLLMVLIWVLNVVSWVVPRATSFFRSSGSCSGKFEDSITSWIPLWTAFMVWKSPVGLIHRRNRKLH